MPIETAEWDTTRYLKSREDIAAYVEAVFEDGEPALVAHALSEVSRAEGMTQVAKAAGLSRESLCRALSAAGTPELATMLKVMQVLGLTLSAKPARAVPLSVSPAS